MPERDHFKTGERRTPTILLPDMKGFTSLSERMDPEEMASLMTRVFGLFEETLRSHRGIVEKYIGDALVAVFGVPELHEDDLARAVHAAPGNPSPGSARRSRSSPAGSSASPSAPASTPASSPRGGGGSSTWSRSMR